MGQKERCVIMRRKVETYLIMTRANLNRFFSFLGSVHGQ